jgi:hypothetical protein
MYSVHLLTLINVGVGPKRPTLFFEAHNLKAKKIAMNRAKFNSGLIYLCKYAYYTYTCMNVYMEDNPGSFISSSWLHIHCKKKASGFPVPSRDVTNQTLPNRE